MTEIVASILAEMKQHYLNMTLQGKQEILPI